MIHVASFCNKKSYCFLITVNCRGNSDITKNLLRGATGPAETPDIWPLSSLPVVYHDCSSNGGNCSPTPLSLPVERVLPITMGSQLPGNAPHHDICVKPEEHADLWGQVQVSIHVLLLQQLQGDPKPMAVRRVAKYSCYDQ